MVSFSYKNLDYLQAATIALDFVEQADKNFKNIGGNEQLALRKLVMRNASLIIKQADILKRAMTRQCLRLTLRNTSI